MPCAAYDIPGARESRGKTNERGIDVADKAGRSWSPSVDVYVKSYFKYALCREITGGNREGGRERRKGVEPRICAD